MNAQTLNCALIAPLEGHHALLREAISGSSLFELSEWLKDYPSEEKLLRMLRISSPDLLIVDFADMPRALEIVALVQRHASTIEILALCEENISVLSILLRAGVRDYITKSSDRSNVELLLRAQAEKLLQRPSVPRLIGDVVTFLPAKPGSGASTIAANAAFAASRVAKKRTLLADFDCNAGVLSFLFKLGSKHSLGDALSSVEDMDAEMWARLRSKIGNLDILPSDLDAGSMMDSSSALKLIEFFRRAYDLTCIDLSGQLDSTTMEALLESKRIYIVCTQELACQHLLLHKVKRLRQAGLDKQMRLIVNRFLPHHVMTAERISEMVGIPVELTIINDYETANCSMEAGALIKTETSLGKSYTKLAEIMINERIAAPRSKPSLLEFFSHPFLRSSTASSS